MKRLKTLFPSLLIGLIFLSGVGVMAYPAISDLWNRRVQTRAVASYNASAAALSEKDYTEYLEAAKAYNEAIRRAGSAAALSDPDIVPGYEEMLNIGANGVIGSITIDKIGVNLPIYHGTSASVLTMGAGHLEGSSLPTGGESTHTVISAHRGLPRAKLFTDLDKMETGDIFELHVLGDTLYYEVDRISVVLPSEMEEIYIQSGQDLCTLMTCTPYGINTHRLLVRGHRIYLSEEEIEAIEEAKEQGADHIWILVILVILVIFTAIFAVRWLSEVFVRISGSKKNGDPDR